ncbi:hypothetical protein JL720_16308 [Aureococcus anophagefferens]|nr:hypothetical protein JL720_16308 [Aureococcus anophagefferens]
MAPRRLDLRAVAGGGRPAPGHASASQGQPPGSARDELPLTARSRPKAEGHAIDDAELALTHAQEGTRLASALEDVGERHARKLAGLANPGDRTAARGRIYEAAVTLEQAKTSMCFVSELDDGLHRGERLWSCQGHGAVVLSTRSALLHEFAAKRCGLVFAVPAPVVAVAHDDDDDYSVTPTESEDDGRAARAPCRLVKVAPSEVFYCAPADDPAALAASSIAEAPPNAVGVAEDVAVAKGDRLVSPRRRVCGRLTRRTAACASSRRAGRRAPVLRGVARRVLRRRALLVRRRPETTARALLGSAGAAIFKTGVDHTSGIRNEGGVVSLVGLRVRPRPSPPPEVGAVKPPASDDDDDDDEASLRRRADRWATPPGAWGRFTHEAASVSGFLRALDAEGRRRERDRPRRKRPRDRARTRATKSSAEDTKGDGGLRVVKRKLRAELATYLNHHHQPPPNLDVADQAPQFVASMAAIRGVRAVVRLAVDYSGTKHEDPEGAMAAFLQVARLASVKGPPGDENAAAAAAHVRLRASMSRLLTAEEDADAASQGSLRSVGTLDSTKSGGGPLTAATGASSTPFGTVAGASGTSYTTPDSSRDGDSLARDDGGSFFDGGSVGSATNATSVSAEEEEHINEGDELMKKSKIMKEQLARRIGRELGYLKPQLASIERTGPLNADATRCWRRIHYLCVQKPAELEAAMEAAEEAEDDDEGDSEEEEAADAATRRRRRKELHTPRDRSNDDAALVAAASPHGADDSQRPPPVALPAAEIDELIEKEQRDRLLVHRSVAEEMGHEAPKAPRKWHLDRPRPPAVSPAKARAELPHPLVPSRALRDRVFDKLMTGASTSSPTTSGASASISEASVRACYLAAKR